MNRLDGIGRSERTVRNSRFVGVCGPARDESDARDFIASRGEAGCRHVCWAFRCGDVVRFDDAGEPGGTAGRPILAALEHFDLDRAVAVVSRWFGGVKLGTGGLGRAYAGGVDLQETSLGHRWQQGDALPFILVMIALYTLVRLGLSDSTTDTLPHLLDRPPTTLRQFTKDYRDVWEADQVARD